MSRCIYLWRPCDRLPYVIAIVPAQPARSQVSHRDAGGAMRSLQPMPRSVLTPAMPRQATAPHCLQLPPCSRQCDCQSFAERYSCKLKLADALPQTSVHSRNCEAAAWRGGRSLVSHFQNYRKSDLQWRQSRFNFATVTKVYALASHRT